MVWPAYRYPCDSGASSQLGGQSRNKYYDTLKKADKGNLVPFVNFVASAVERSLDLNLRALEPTGKEDRLLSLSEAAKATRYTQEYLSLLARKRRIAAVKVGRTWMITQRELHRYVKEVEGRLFHQR